MITNRLPDKHLWVAALVFVLMLLLASCSSPQPLLEIAGTRAGSPPVVGEFFELEVELLAHRALSNGTFVFHTMAEQGIPIFSEQDQKAWQFGEIAKGERLTVSMEICVQQVGIWPVYLVAYTTIPGGGRPNDAELLHIHATKTGGKLIPSNLFIFYTSERLRASRSSPEIFYPCTKAD